MAKRAFNNYVDPILPNFDPPPPPSSGQAWTFYNPPPLCPRGQNIDKLMMFFNYESKMLCSMVANPVHNGMR